MNRAGMDRLPAPVAATAMSREPYRTTRDMLGTRIAPPTLPWSTRSGISRLSA